MDLRGTTGDPPSDRRFPPADGRPRSRRAADGRARPGAGRSGRDAGPHAPQGRPAGEDLRRLRPALRLAAEMGAGVGRGAILLGALPPAARRRPGVRQAVAELFPCPCDPVSCRRAAPARCVGVLDLCHCQNACGCRKTAVYWPPPHVPESP